MKKTVKDILAVLPALSMGLLAVGAVALTLVLIVGTLFGCEKRPRHEAVSHEPTKVTVVPTPINQPDLVKEAPGHNSISFTLSFNVVSGGGGRTREVVFGWSATEEIVNPTIVCSKSQHNIYVMGSGNAGDNEFEIQMMGAGTSGQFVVSFLPNSAYKCHLETVIRSTGRRVSGAAVEVKTGP